MADALDESGEFSATLSGLETRTRGLQAGASGFASAMQKAFTSGVAGGKQFDDVLKSLALRLSDLTLRLALRPVASGLISGLQGLFSGGTAPAASLTAAMGAIKPFASGGVIAAPTYFPLQQGGVGLAGEAGPEAILPLARGPNGQLGVAMNGGGGGAVTINITTPDAESFRRSEVYLTGQIARAVARGQRGM
jgi:phage-related minor tail protein